MVRVTVLPTAASVLPVMVGVASLVLSGALTLMVGAVRSMLPVSLALPVLPALSVTLAETLYGPSTRALGTSALKVPPASTWAVVV